MGIFDRIREKDRKLRESNRRRMSQADEKIAPYVNRTVTLGDTYISPEYRGSKQEQNAKRREEQKMTPQMRKANLERLKRQGKSTDKPRIFRAFNFLDKETAPKAASAPKIPYRLDTKTTPSASKPPASAPSAAPKKQEVMMGTAPATKSENPTPPKKPQQAAPTISKPASTPKPRNYSRDAMDMLGGSDKGALSEDNAVMKKLRERAAMSAAERDKAPEFKSKYADKLNKAMGYAKGGSVDGCAKKGKTRGRII